MTLSDVMKIPYVRNGRTLDGMDCYGLTRFIRQEWFNKFTGIDYICDKGDVKKLTFMVREGLKQLNQCKMTPGAIVIVKRRQVCTHIAVCIYVDNMIKILDTDEGRGCKLWRPSDFSKVYGELTFYD